MIIKFKKSELKQTLGLLLLMIIAFSATVLADTDDTTVTFIIPESIAHSIAYAASCTSSDFACRENDGTLDGTQNDINITQTDGTACQTASTPIVTITNDGNADMNISWIFTSALPSGVEFKVGNETPYWNATCPSPQNATWGLNDIVGCKNVTGESSARVAHDLAASATEQIWGSCDFSNFNSGAATSGITRTLRSTGASS